MTWRIWHLTDLHAGRVGSLAFEAVEEVVRSAGRHDVVAVTGDITDDGTPTQYDDAERMLRPLRGRLLLAPGNHDYGALGIAYSEQAEAGYLDLCRRLSAPLPGIPWMVGEWLLLSLDSCLKTDTPADLACGRVGETQLRRLAEAQQLAEAVGLRTAVALHHDPATDEVGRRLLDAAAVLRATWGVVDLVLFGHTHGPATQWTATEARPTTYRRGRDALSGGAWSVWQRAVD